MAAPSPLDSLMQDPAFAMFVTASGMQEQLQLADVARRRHAINQSLGIQEEQIADQGQQQRKGIAGDQEARGMFRSGQTLDRTAQSEKSQARASALAQLDSANQLGDLESNFLTNQVNRQFDIGQKALGVAEGLAEEQGDSDLDARLKALEGAGATTTGLGGVGPLAPGPQPIADVAISRKQAFNPTGKAKRAF